MKHSLFQGSAAALITPFTPDGAAIDLPLFASLIESQIKNGTDALVVAGTTGESPVLTKEEKKTLFACAVNTADKRVPVIAGTGSNNTQDAVRKSNLAEKEGVDGLLIVTPFYNKCTQEGLVRHYFYIADRVTAPIIVYNVPSRTGVDIRPETYAALAEHPRIVGIKEANGDISAAAKAKRLCGDALSLYSGNDDQTIPMIAIGGEGVISVAANIVPDRMHAICEAALNGRIREAAKLQKPVADLMELLFCSVNPIPVKKAVELRSGVKQTLRLPLTELDFKNTERLRCEMQKLGLLQS